MRRLHLLQERTSIPDEVVHEQHHGDLILIEQDPHLENTHMVHGWSAYERIRFVDSIGSQRLIDQYASCQNTHASQEIDVCTASQLNQVLIIQDHRQSFAAKAISRCW